MNTQTTPRKVYTIGTEQFVLPFKACGFYVDDRNCQTVLQAQSFEGAKALAKMLNELAQA